MVLLYHLRILVVRAKACPDGSPGGKRFLVDPFFTLRGRWRDLIIPRANTERHFAWMKRYFSLKYFRVQGYFAVT